VIAAARRGAEDHSDDLRFQYSIKMKLKPTSTPQRPCTEHAGPGPRHPKPSSEQESQQTQEVCPSHRPCASRNTTSSRIPVCAFHVHIANHIDCQVHRAAEKQPAVRSIDQIFVHLGSNAQSRSREHSEMSQCTSAFESPTNCCVCRAGRRSHPGTSESSVCSAALDRCDLEPDIHLMMFFVVPPAASTISLT